MSDPKPRPEATLTSPLTERDLDDLRTTIELWSQLRASLLSTLYEDLNHLKTRIRQQPDGVEAFTWGLDQLDELLTWHDREAQLLRHACLRIASLLAELADEAKATGETPDERPALH